MDNNHEISLSQEMGSFDNYYSQLYEDAGNWRQQDTTPETLDAETMQKLFPNLGYFSNEVPTVELADDTFIQEAGPSRYQDFLNSALIKDETVNASSSPTSLGTIEAVYSPPVMDIVSTSHCSEVQKTFKSPSSLPASENWGGDCGFKISLEKITKNNSWTYSPYLKKLFVCMGASFPISFSTTHPMPEKVKIRATALFSSPESAGEVVRRCKNHIELDKDNNVLEADHFVRCESVEAVYEIDEITKHRSVLVPYENPSAGQHFSTYIYKFTCLSSCPGPSRRPLMVVFSLLNGDDEVIGRRKLNVKICACPLRDKASEEQRAKANEPERIQEKLTGKHIMEPKSKKRKVDTTDNMVAQSSKTKKVKTESNSDEYFQIRVKDKKCYEFLEQMKTYYALIKSYKNLSHDVKRVLEEHQRRKGIYISLDECLNI